MLETVGTAFHDTVALLFNNVNRTSHVSGDTTGSGSILPRAASTRPCPPTPLLHLEYKDHDQYPQGVGDMVDYWAEVQVFGGVVLFDRGETDCGMSCPPIKSMPSKLSLLLIPNTENAITNTDFGPAIDVGA